MIGDGGGNLEGSTSDSGMGVHTGRFAPSPTGPLHLGNLRTALLAWLFARAAGSRRSSLRVEDLDAERRRGPSTRPASSPTSRALGLDWDGPVVRQSRAPERYADGARRSWSPRAACTPASARRAEIREAASRAPRRAARGRLPGHVPRT